MSLKFSELQKSKVAAERKAKEVAAAVDSLTGDLHRERQLNNSTVNLAKKATRENAAIKRALQSFGCKVQFSTSGDCVVDTENSPSSLKNSMFSSSRRESNGSYDCDEKSDLLVSITVVADISSSNGLPADLCEGRLCPMHKRDSVCRWPDAGCAHFGSQIAGLMANFDAFDQLSIYNSYF